MFSIKLHHGGKFTASPKRMYVGGKVNYVDNIDVDLFNVDEVYMFIQDLGYDPKQLMYYHFKLLNKSLDYGLRPLSCDDDLVGLINIVETFKLVEVFIEYWLTSVDHHYLSPFKPSVKIEELDDDVKLNASMVGSSKRLALEWITKDDVRESSVDKNGNVNEEHNMNVDEVNVDLNVNEEQNLNVDEVNVDLNVNEEQNLNVDDYKIDDNYKFNVQDNLNLNDYTVNVDENMNIDENVNVDKNVNVDENVNVDKNVNVDEKINADDKQDSDEENKQDIDEDEQGRGDDWEDFIIDE
ncbi:hypothetical protein Tco_1052618 [Tanacetum coccineum]